MGDFKEPLTLHAYLYCANDPINFIDPTGEYALNAVIDAIDTYAFGLDVLVIGMANDDDSLFKLGEFIVRLTPVVYAASLATAGILGNVDDILADGKKGLSDDQNALKDLLRERKQKGKALDSADVDIIKGWADELGLIFRDDRGKGRWIGGDHIHVDGIGDWGDHVPTN